VRFALSDEEFDVGWAEEEQMSLDRLSRKLLA
jgi:hypothetical protein